MYHLLVLDMKFKEKYVLLHHRHNGNKFDRALSELEEYDFPGVVDFANAPTCSYNAKHQIVLPTTNGGDPFALLINGKLVTDPANQKDLKFLEASSYQLGRKQTLQDFFDIHKSKPVIVFYLTEGGSIYHEGGVVRPFVFETADQDL